MHPKALLKTRYRSSTLFPFYFVVSLLELNIRQKGTLIVRGVTGRPSRVS